MKYPALGSLFVAICTLTMAAPATADVTWTVPLPRFDDPYSRLVAQAEAGDTNIDYRALRLAWLDSAAHKQWGNFNPLMLAMVNVAPNDNAAARDAAIKVLAVNYVEIRAQTLLANACHSLGEQTCANRHAAIVTGLLNSLTDHGDGKTVETAWTIVDFHEEDWTVHVLGATRTALHRHKTDGKTWDQMDVTINGQPRTLYFDITAMYAKQPG